MTILRRYILKELFQFFAVSIITFTFILLVAKVFTFAAYDFHAPLR